jgi:hypothetical protein
LLVLVGQAIDPLLPDIREWLARPSGPDGYLAASYPVVVRAVAISVALACVLAWLVGLVSTARRRRSGRSARYRPGGTWNTLFDSLVPRDKLPYVSVRLSDGTRLSGYVTKWRTSADGESGQLVVWGPNLSVKPRGGDQIPLDRWDSVVVRLDQVAYVQVAYRGTAQGGRAAEAALGDGSDDDVPEQVPDDARVS